MSDPHFPPMFVTASRTDPSVSYAELTRSNGERVTFAWDTGSDHPVTIRCYCPKGFNDQKTNLPRKAARSFWDDLIALDGFAPKV